MNANCPSIYIPRMCKTTTEDKICDIMYDYHIGHVSHIDFTCVNKKPGFIEDDGDEKFKSAFIHFNKPFHFYVFLFFFFAAGKRMLFKINR